MFQNGYETNDVKIGSRVRPGGAAASGPKVLRGSSAINQAQRSGAAMTEKKFTGGLSRPDQEGQRMAKLDRTDEIIKPKTIGKEVGSHISKTRQTLKNQKGTTMTQTDFAKLVNSTPAIIAEYERGMAKPDQALLNRMERVLGIVLRGDNIGQPRVVGGKKK